MLSVTQEIMNPVPKLIDALKTCIKNKDLSSAKDIHALLFKYGLENNEDIGNHLVPMLIECGSIFDAREVFDRIFRRNVHSWTYLIAGYIRHGEPGHALDLYSKMCADYVQPNNHTFTALLKACSSLKDMQHGEAIHLEVVKKGFEQDLFVSGALVDIYVKRGWFPEACVVFEMLMVKDIVLWNEMIMGYAEYGEDHCALECFKAMYLHGTYPNAATFSCILKTFGSLGDIEKAQELYEEVVKKGLEKELFIISSLIEMYVRCGRLFDARSVLESLPCRNVVLWNQLIIGYGEYRIYKEVVKCVELMQQEGIKQDIVTMIWLLKTSSNMQTIQMGLESHIEVIKQGVEADVYLGSTIVDMYVKFGLISEAKEVFLMLPSRNVVAWNVLITGYAEHGPFEQAFRCIQQMEDENVSPTSLTFIGILKACANIRSKDKGLITHSKILCKGLEGDHSVRNTLIDMYGDNGMLLEARKVFDNMLKHSVVSWNTLISGYIEHGHSDEALQCFEQMKNEGISQDVVTFSLTLKACNDKEAFSKGQEIYIDIIKKGFEDDHVVGSILVDMYMKCCHSIVESQDVFDKMPCQTVLSWNSLIAGYSIHGFEVSALEGLQHMQSQGLSPTSVSYTYVINGCCSMKDVYNGKEIHMRIVKKGYERDPLVINALIGMYVKCGMLNEAQICVSTDEDVLSWSTLIAAHADLGCWEEVLGISERMQAKGLYRDAVTHASILKACGAMKFLEKGQHVHMTVVHQGLDRDATVCGALVGFYMKWGSLEEAKLVFESVHPRNIVCYNCLLAGYTEHGFGLEALSCFERMQDQGISPNSVTYLFVLKACGSKLGAVEKAWENHKATVLRGFELDCHVGSTLVDMYIKYGFFKEAHHVFNNLPMRNNVAWNALIKGYGLHHEGKVAIQLFEEMCAQGMKPDAITFTCLLTTCSRGSMISMGQEMFKIMKDEYGIVPTEDHVFCIVDLLARSGALHEAGKYLDSTHCPSEDLWTTLLSACGTYQEGMLGSKCFDHLDRRQ